MTQTTLRPCCQERQPVASQVRRCRRRVEGAELGEVMQVLGKCFSAATWIFCNLADYQSNQEMVCYSIVIHHNAQYYLQRSLEDIY